MLDLSKVKDSVIVYHEAGINVFPAIYGSKTTNTHWKSFQEKFLNKDERLSMFKDSNSGNIAGLGGATSGNLAILDIDNPRVFENTIAKEKRFEEIRHSTWESLTASGRPHIYIVTEEPIKTSKQNLEKYGFEIRGEGGYALLPPSYVEKDGQQGLEYQWIRKSTNKPLLLTNSELNEMGILTTPIPEKEKSSLKPHGISWQFWKPLVLGNFESCLFSKADKTNKSLSELEFHFILHLIDLNFSNERIINFFEEKLHSKTRYKTLPTYQNRRRDYLLSTIQEARRVMLNTSKLSDKLFQNLNKIPFREIFGRSANTTRNTYGYALEVFKRTGKESINLSVRELAENTGMSISTASNSIDRLIKKSFLEEGNKNDFWEAKSYKLSSKPLEFELSKEISYQRETTSNDAFRSELGKTGALLFDTLTTNEEISLKDLWENCRSIMSRSTLFRKLKQFKRKGIIEINSNVITLKIKDLDSIAEALGTKGKSEKVKEKFSNERKIHRKNVKDIQDMLNKKGFVKHEPSLYVNPITGEFRQF
jgi:predicted transcriptional regulator